MCVLQATTDLQDYHDTQTNHPPVSIRHAVPNSAATSTPRVEWKVVKPAPDPPPGIGAGSHKEYTTSTPSIPPRGGGTHFPPTGQDGPISPIRVLEGDDHPKAAIVCHTAHDGPVIIDDVSSTPHHNSDNYIHPADLAESRRAEWPAPVAIVDNYPRLASIYSLVRDTGLPNAMQSRLPLPTNLNVQCWINIATGHTDDDIVIEGVMYGFHSQYWGAPRPTSNTGYNHVSANAYPRPPLRSQEQFVLYAKEFIARAMAKRGAVVLIYLDDIVGVAQTLQEAEHQFHTACELLGDLGLPLAVKKLEPPAKSIKWLGIKCDIPTRTLSLPEDKVKEVLHVISTLHERSAMSRKEVQQLAGKINFIARVCRPARLFMARILSYLRAHPPGYRKVAKGAKADMRWFMSFLPTYNGVSIIPDDAPSVIIEADSCLKGGGAVCGSMGYILEYDARTSQDHHISQLEAMNCMVAIRVMLTQDHKGKLIEVHCDNSAAVSIYHTGKGRDPVILACARAIWDHAARIDCSLTFRHIPGNLMTTADALSRAPLSAAHSHQASRVAREKGLTMIQVSPNALSYATFM